MNREFEVLLFLAQWMAFAVYHQKIKMFSQIMCCFFVILHVENKSRKVLAIYEKELSAIGVPAAL